MNPLKPLKKLFANKSRKLDTVHDLGFHGDKYLLEIADDLLDRTDYFVETGANVASTATYVAKRHPRTKVLTCEPNATAFSAAKKTLAPFSNAEIYMMKSPDFLGFIHNKHQELFRSKNFYFLDAHGYGYEWPLRDEISFITSRLESGVILVDDFKVPSRPDFEYGKYMNNECNFDYIEPALAAGRKYSFFYPGYSEKTSTHHPLTGYVFIVFGDEEIEQTIRQKDFFSAVVAEKPK